MPISLAMWPVFAPIETFWQWIVVSTYYSSLLFVEGFCTDKGGALHEFKIWPVVSRKAYCRTIRYTCVVDSSPHVEMVDQVPTAAWNSALSIASWGTLNSEEFSADGFEAKSSHAYGS